MNNESAHNEDEHAREDGCDGSLDYAWTGRIQGKDLDDASGQKEASDHDLGPADGANFVALRREVHDNQTLTDERNNYPSCSIRRSISLN